MFFQRLGKNLDTWHSIGASAAVLSWVEFGVPIPFKVKPNKTFLRNPVFTKKHSDFIRGELKTLLHKGAIELCTIKPLFISPINVVPISFD